MVTKRSPSDIYSWCCVHHSVACLRIVWVKLSCRFIGREDQSFEDEEPPEIYNGALPDAFQLEWYKKYKDKETRTLSAFKSLTFFTLFMLVLGIVCYGSRDYHHYLIAEEVKAIFPRADQASKVYSKCIRGPLFKSYKCAFVDQRLARYKFCTNFILNWGVFDEKPHSLQIIVKLVRTSNFYWHRPGVTS